MAAQRLRAERDRLSMRSSVLDTGLAGSAGTIAPPGRLSSTDGHKGGDSQYPSYPPNRSGMSVFAGKPAPTMAGLSPALEPSFSLATTPAGNIDGPTDWPQWDDPHHPRSTPDWPASGLKLASSVAHSYAAPPTSHAPTKPPHTTASPAGTPNWNSPDPSPWATSPPPSLHSPAPATTSARSSVSNTPPLRFHETTVDFQLSQRAAAQTPPSDALSFTDLRSQASTRSTEQPTQSPPTPTASQSDNLPGSRSSAQDVAPLHKRIAQQDQIINQLQASEAHLKRELHGRKCCHLDSGPFSTARPHIFPFFSIGLSQEAEEAHHSLTKVLEDAAAKKWRGERSLRADINNYRTRMPHKPQNCARLKPNSTAITSKQPSAKAVAKPASAKPGLSPSVAMSLPPLPDGNAPRPEELREVALAKMERRVEELQQQLSDARNLLEASLNERKQLRAALAKEQSITARLEQETNTIGDYVIMYQKQRAAFREQLAAKDAELASLRGDVAHAPPKASNSASSAPSRPSVAPPTRDSSYPIPSRPQPSTSVDHLSIPRQHRPQGLLTDSVSEAGSDASNFMDGPVDPQGPHVLTAAASARAQAQSSQTRSTLRPSETPTWLLQAGRRGGAATEI
ncbi:uncharacterized protein MONBRDRAFT_10516 [Monosiga brevicollis MX1]|uniref:Uncharacterized protein n=1 Tax=Monosiga brevicollis TaxID=81824 RepID=A9V6L0_MONBE|nr:uncharacterized protein MONBRDRAFT_10516 [Monosiga brevicollis MX1]EDQ86826.1 predicted protein [Monosiga brevicollis MX1]|eukprot:XP_001748371.1 hypothetical protein [Monosiga brevicollis MX1]